MVRLEREHIETSDERLHDIYDAYRNMVKCLNEVAGSGRFNPETYAIEVPDKPRLEMSSVMLEELSRMEDIVQDFKNLLRWMASLSARKKHDGASGARNRK